MPVGGHGAASAGALAGPPAGSSRPVRDAPLHSAPGSDAARRAMTGRRHHRNEVPAVGPDDARGRRPARHHRRARGALVRAARGAVDRGERPGLRARPGRIGPPSSSPTCQGPPVRRRLRNDPLAGPAPPDPVLRPPLRPHRDRPARLLPVDPADLLGRDRDLRRGRHRSSTPATRSARSSAGLPTRSGGRVGSDPPPPDGAGVGCLVPGERRSVRGRSQRTFQMLRRDGGHRAVEVTASTISAARRPTRCRPQRS